MRAAITSVAGYLPDDVLSNADLEKMVDVKYDRPKEQWWMKLEEIINLFGRSSALIE